MRRFFTILAAVSLLACCGLCVLWVRSISTGDSINYLARSGTSCSLGTRPHRVDLTVTTCFSRFWTFRYEHGRGFSYSCIRWGKMKPAFVMPNTTRSILPGSSINIPDQGSGTNFVTYYGGMWGKPFHFLGGFGWASDGMALGRPPLSYHWTRVTAPCWFLMLLLGLPPLVWARQRFRRLGRLRRGLCTACGYDLTANASGKCPECGQTVRSQSDRSMA